MIAMRFVIGVLRTTRYDRDRDDTEIVTNVAVWQYDQYFTTGSVVHRSRSVGQFR
jgi:hypothetical protein